MELGVLPREGSRASQAAVAPTPPPSVGRKRRAGIDVLKGLAILGVIAQHGVPSTDQDAIFGEFYVEQAVPVFMLLLAMNAAPSLWRRCGGTLREAYTRVYATSRLRRIALPIAVAWLLSLVLGLALGRVSFGPLIAVGVFPLAGPGNYFVPLLVSFTVIAPALAWTYRRAPVATVVALITVNVAFELAAGDVIASRHDDLYFLYQASLLRYGAVLALGLVLADRKGRVPVAVLAALFAVGVAYLAAVRAAPDAFDFLVPGFVMTTNAATAGLTLAIVWAVLRLPERVVGDAALRPLARAGEASLHIFLVQMLWFAAVPGHGVWHFVAAVAVSMTAGYAAFELERRLLPTT